MKQLYLAFLCGMALTSGTARAGLLDIAFQDSTLAGGPGAVLQFFGTLDNTTGSDLFLNADDFSLSGFDASTIDDSPWFANTPASGFLDPNASTGVIGLFNVPIPESLAEGNYAGTFELLGGATSDDQTIIGSADFTVQVTPEPSPGILLFTASLALALIKTGLCRSQFHRRAQAMGRIFS
jgi:hypothetical protein